MLMGVLCLVTSYYQACFKSSVLHSGLSVTVHDTLADMDS